MDPLPLANPNATHVIHHLLSAVLQSLKSNHTLLRPYQPSPKGGESTDTMDWQVPPTPGTPLARSQLPTSIEFGLKPPRPEEEPWWEILSGQDTDDYHELTSNPWSYKRKRSGTLSPAVAGIPMMLTY